MQRTVGVASRNQASIIMSGSHSQMQRALLFKLNKRTMESWPKPQNWYEMAATRIDTLKTRKQHSNGWRNEQPRALEQWCTHNRRGTPHKFFCPALRAFATARCRVNCCNLIFWFFHFALIWPLSAHIPYWMISSFPLGFIQNNWEGIYQERSQRKVKLVGSVLSRCIV